jgi:N-acetylglucosaminyldiphosphoundecaprenol N-acetyl-beta-D-mannosaminyltransferase
MSVMVEKPENADAKYELFGIAFDSARLSELAEAIAVKPSRGQGTRFVVTANVDHIVQLRTNEGLRAAYLHSWKRTVDGTPVWLYARIRGVYIPERVTGADMFPAVMRLLLPGEHRAFFVVANDYIGRRLFEWLVGQGFDESSVAYEVPSFGFEKDRGYGEMLSAKIREHGTTHLFFGVGCPRSEIWIDRHRNVLGDVYAMAVGAALGFFVGVERRAPRIMRAIGMEWLWRAALEPKRLGFRYFVRSWGFFAAVVSDLSRKVR